MTRLLRDTGTALYGPRWQSDLARDLGVSDRTVRYWLAGNDIPAGVYSDLQRIAQARALDIDRVIDRLVATVDPP